MTEAQLQILITAQNQASAVLRQVQGDTADLESKTNALSSVYKGLMATIATYAGSRGLGMLIDASVESQQQTAQARFFLAGYAKDVTGTLATLQKFGSAMQRTTGVGDEYATLVAAKLLPRVKDLNKAQSYASILLHGQRLGILDAQQASNMMIRASEGNEKALRMLLETMGLSAPSFASLDSMFAILNDRITEGEKSMPRFANAWATLKESFGDMMENAGAPLVEFLGTALTYVNQLIDRYPIIGTVVSATMAVLFTLFAAAGIAMGANFVMPVITGIGTVLTALGALVGGGMLMGAGIVAAVLIAVAAAYLLYTHWDTVKGWLLAVWEGMKFAWNATVDWISDKMLAGAQIITGAWDAFKKFWGDMWDAVKAKIDAVWSYVSGIVDSIVASVNRAISAMASIGGGISAGVNYVTSLAGFRANGGAVDAGKTYVVGENGAEFFTPSTSGYVSPTMAGVTVNIVNPTVLNEQGARDLVDMTLAAFGRSHLFGL